MKLLCLTIVVCLVFSAEAVPWEYDTNPVIKSAFHSLEKFFSFATKSEQAMVHDVHRLRRQSRSCLQDIQETNGQRFHNCSALLQTFESGENVTANAVMQFCGRGHCPGYLISLAERLVQDCNFPDSLDPSMKTLINQSCDQAPNHTPCISVWYVQNASTIAVTYEKCIEEYSQNDRICNVDCKTTENWIKENLGCCYRAYVEYKKSIGEAGGLLTDDNWDLCNVKEPDLCNGRPPPPVTRGPPHGLVTRGPPHGPVTRGPPHGS